MKQLIVTAEREIIRDLPGKPYEDYLELISLQEENAKLKRQVDDYKARLGAPLQDAGQVQEAVPSRYHPNRSLRPGLLKSDRRRASRR